MAGSAKFQTPTTIATDCSINSQSTNRAFCRTQASPVNEAGSHAMGEMIQQQQQQLGFSDMNLASRKANEAAVRRFQAASWLQKMVGPLDISPEPTEEEFRLCLRNGIVLCNVMNRIHPGAVSKIVENPTFSLPSQEGAPLSAYQYFENVRNFLVAVEELNLPSFEASDLDEGVLPTGLPVKVVDCILSLKAYHEWQQAGGHGLWKIVGPLKPSFPFKSPTKSSSGTPGLLGQATSKPNSQGTNTGALDGFRDLYEELESQHGKHGFNQVCVDGQFPHEELENGWSNFDSNAGWVHQVCQKFVEVYLAKRKEVDTYVPCEALMRMVMMVLHDKQPAEVPVIVEFMLKRVIEESDRRFSGQLKKSHSRGLEDHNRDSLDEKRVVLQRELQRLRSLDHQRAEQLDIQRDELQELRLAFESIRLECQDAQIGWEEEMENLNSKLQGLVQAASEYHKVAAENRELYNQVQDLRGNIRVYCRVRPFLPGQNVTQSSVDYIGEEGSITIASPTKQGKEHRKYFNFNKVYGPSASQEEVFLDTQPLIRSVLDGFNVCIFAYGQTGSGKTYTMTGPNNPSSKDWGVNFRALHDLFELAQYRNDLVHYDVGVQMIEIYNEQVRDLLCADGSNKKLEIRNNSQQNGLNVPDASMISVHSTEDVLDLMKMGHRNRAVGATALNDRSSRSHSVLTVHIKGKELASGTALRGCLHLVDLAGSERVDKSEATGDRLKEAQHINKSLSALGDVIAALAQKSAHVPYRNSKLTQLLQDSLGGHAKTLMFVHVSPDADSYGESISTLKFAERVALVELGAAQSNKESGDIRELKEQVTYLKEALVKKDSKLERIQRESRPKISFESNHDSKPRSKASHANGLGHGHSNRRQPLEEVCQVQNTVSHSDYIMSDLPMHPHSPLGNQAAFFGLAPEDLGKPKTSGKPPRDPILSPPHVTSHSVSRNKLRWDHHAGETIHSNHHPQHNLTVRAGRNGFIANGHGLNDAHEPKRQQNGHARSPSIAANQLGSHSPFADKGFHVQHQRSHSYTYPESIDGSIEGSPGRQFEYDEYEEDDEGTSDFSEERWHKDADTMSPCSLRGDANHHVLAAQGKGRPEGDKRTPSYHQQQQGGNPHVKKGVESSPSSSSSGGGGGKVGEQSPGSAPRPQRFSVSKARGKTTLERKLVPISPEKGAVDKASSRASLAAAPKRWV